MDDVGAILRIASGWELLALLRGGMTLPRPLAARARAYAAEARERDGAALATERRRTEPLKRPWKRAFQADPAAVDRILKRRAARHRAETRERRKAVARRRRVARVAA